MKPPKREYEQVEVDTWLNGEITDIQYEESHEFTYKGNVNSGPGVKIIIKLDDYKDSKHTRWMYFNYGEKSNLYKLWLSPLVQGAKPNMDFDLDGLKGTKIKVMYAQNGEYQNLVMVRPLVPLKPAPAGKAAQKKTSDLADVAENEEEDQVPF